MSAFSRTSQRVRHRCPLRAEIKSWTISGSVRDIKACWTFDLWPLRGPNQREQVLWSLKSGRGCCVGFHGDDTQRHASWVRVVIWGQGAAGWARLDVFLSQSSEAKMVPESGGKNKRLHSFGPLSPLSSMWDVLEVSSCWRPALGRFDGTLQAIDSRSLQGLELQVWYSFTFWTVGFVSFTESTRSVFSPGF